MLTLGAPGDEDKPPPTLPGAQAAEPGAASAATAPPAPRAAPPAAAAATAATAVAAYLRRWGGVPGRRRPPVAGWRDAVLAVAASFCGVAAVSALHYELLARSSPSHTMLIGSFGASAVLLYAAPAAALSQPRCLLGGHVLSALVGVAVRVGAVQAGGAPEWLGCALAVSLAIGAMLATGTLHPPGGATALIAVTGDAAVKRLGFLFALLPTAAGAALLLLVALALNNLREGSRYPMYW